MREFFFIAFKGTLTLKLALMVEISGKVINCQLENRASQHWDLPYPSFFLFFLPSIMK